MQLVIVLHSSASGGRYGHCIRGRNQVRNRHGLLELCLHIQLNQIRYLVRPAVRERFTHAHEFVAFFSYVPNNEILPCNAHCQFTRFPPLHQWRRLLARALGVIPAVAPRPLPVEVVDGPEEARVAPRISGVVGYS